MQDLEIERIRRHLEELEGVPMDIVRENQHSNEIIISRFDKLEGASRNSWNCVSLKPDWISFLTSRDTNLIGVEIGSSKS